MHMGLELCVIKEAFLRSWYSWGTFSATTARFAGTSTLPRGLIGWKKSQSHSLSCFISDRHSTASAGYCLGTISSLLVSSQEHTLVSSFLRCGRAIAQAVSRRLSTAAARVRAEVRSCGQSGTAAGFLRVLRFPCQFSFHRLLHTHHHLRLVQ
jgi:hypothetical protein